MNTSFQFAQLAEIRQERRERAAKFAATKATAEIGVCSNFPGAYTVNTLNGPRKPNFENAEFESEIEAIKAYARQFGTGTMKKTKQGTYLVFC